jgi:hypothetical protein
MKRSFDDDSDGAREMNFFNDPDNLSFLKAFDTSGILPQYDHHNQNPNIQPNQNSMNLPNDNNDDDYDDDADIVDDVDDVVIKPEPNYASARMAQNLPSKNRPYIYECPIKYCSVILQSEPLLTQHISANHNLVFALIQRALALKKPQQRPQPATNIPDTSPSSDDLSSIGNNNSKNMRKTPTGEQETVCYYYQCPDCEEKFNYPWEFQEHGKKHKTIHGVQTSKSHIKSSLTTTDFAKKLIEMDEKNHQETLKVYESLQTITGTVCPYSNCRLTKPLSSTHALKVHVSSAHLYLRYICPLCGISTTQISECSIHAAKEHLQTLKNLKDFLRWEGKQDPLKKPSSSNQNE